MLRVFLFQSIVLTTLLVSCAGCQFGRAIAPRTASWWNGNEIHRSGIAAQERGDFEEAEQKLQEAVRLNKKDIDFRRNYAEVLWERQKYKESVQQLNEALALGGEANASLQRTIAEKYLALNQPARAYLHADEAVRLDPRDYRSWALKARSGRMLAESARNTDSPEKFDEFILQARNDYYRALSVSPENRELLLELAAVQTLCGQSEQALVTWQELRRTYPSDAVPTEILRGEAEAYVALGRLSEAIICLREAQRRAPATPDISLRLREVQAMFPQQVH